MMDIEETGSGDRVEVLTVDPDVSGGRLDQFVAEAVDGLSRSYAQTLIDDGLVTVGQTVRKASYRLVAGEEVTVRVPPAETVELLPEAIPLDILFENADVIVVNKAAGMVVHPGPGHPTGTLVNALLHHAPDIRINGSVRPGLVHRLDRDTSGVMVIARHDAASQSLIGQWGDQRVRKRYIALAAGRLEADEAVIDIPIARHRTDRQRMAVDRDGKHALSIVHTVERFEEASLLDVDLRTGRTHQIRVHLQWLKHPIIGDGTYGNARSERLAQAVGARRQMLHASTLAFDLPGSGERVEFTAPTPDDIVEATDLLRAGGLDDA